MGLEINKPLCVGGINQNIYLNPYRNNIKFGQGLNADTFERSTVDKYTTEAAIQRMINANPNIKKITKTFNPDTQLNMKDLDKLLKGHSTETKNIANGIAENLPFSLKNKVDIKALNDAAYLHDLGKVLIPENILNKPAKLDEAETKIMHKHSELSYELLKNSGLNEKTLKLIRNHHQNAKKTGYPWVEQNFNADLDLQILSVADKYSALVEVRPYKNKLSAKQALTIIYQDVKEGKLHPFVFKALVDFVNNSKIETTVA